MTWLIRILAQKLWELTPTGYREKGEREAHEKSIALLARRVRYLEDLLAPVALDDEGLVVTDPLRGFGAPTVAGRSIKTCNVAGMFVGEYEVAEGLVPEKHVTAVHAVAEAYEITPEEVCAAVAFEAEIEEHDARGCWRCGAPQNLPQSVRERLGLDVGDRLRGDDESA